MIRFDRFKDGKKHILTMSYDDGATADRRLVEIFNKYKIKGTFHLNSGILDCENRISSKEISSLYNGHEVSAHTVSHPFLERIASANVVQEILNDRQSLEKYCGYIVRGMSYPFGSYSEDVLEIVRNCGIVYARTGACTGHFNMPTNFLTWNPTCHHNNNLMELANRFLSETKLNYTSNLFYVYGHSFEFENDNNWDLIEEFCKTVSFRDDVWYATNIEIYDYLTALRRLQISVDNTIVYNPSAQTVWINNNGETVEIKGGETIKL